MVFRKKTGERKLCVLFGRPLDFEIQDRATRRHLKVALALLEFHRPFLIVIDDAVCALRRSERKQLSDDFWQRVGVRSNGPSTRAAAKRTQTRTYHLRLLSRSRDEALFDGQKRAFADIHGP